MWDVVAGVVVAAALVLAAVLGLVEGLPLWRRVAEWWRKGRERGAVAAPKVEPTFPGEGGDARGRREVYVPPELPELGDAWHEECCYVVRFDERRAQLEARFARLRARLASRGARVYRVLGFDEDEQRWVEAAAGAMYRYWRMLVPLADRRGAATAARLKAIDEECRRFSVAESMYAVLPAHEGALERARLLDEFCSELDVVLNLRVVFAQPIEEEEAAELLTRGYLSPDNGGYVYRLDSETLFSAAPTLSPDDEVTTIVFRLDVPRVTRPQRAVEDMLRCVTKVADTKRGKVVQRGDVELSEADAEQVRATIDAVAQRLLEQGIACGSPLALLLFGN